MSNLSNIGFDVNNEEEFYALIEKAYSQASPVKTNSGTYFQYKDESGAELWIQLNKKNELIGANPHFNGISKRRVSITSSFDRPDSILDGAFHSWADPVDKENLESGLYPFVFDVPNHKEYEDIKIPQLIDIQLCAFAQELDYYNSEDNFEKEQKGEPKWSVQSFVPSGLFRSGDNSNPPEALAIFTGIIKGAEKKENKLTGLDFYWMLIETLGGEIDVLADLNFFRENEPQIGGVAQGQFWLSGKPIQTPKIKPTSKKGILGRIFGKK